MRQGSWQRKLWEDFSNVYNEELGSVEVTHENSSQFGEVLSVTRTPIVELNSSYGTSQLRDKVTETNSGSVTSSDGELVLSTGTTANSVARVESAEVGRYIPGYGAQLGVGVRPDQDPVGEQVARWGGIDQNLSNGFYFGNDATGVFACILRDGVENKVYQSDWNLDTLDGQGSSGFDLSLDEGKIYQIEFTWYGYGQVLFGVIGVVGRKQYFIPCHQFSGFNQSSILSPNLKVFAEVVNNNTASNIQIHVGGRQYSVIGSYDPRFRFTGQWRGSVNTSTTVIPLISFRRKTNFGDRSIRLQGIEGIANQQPHVYEIRLSGSLTGASFGTPTNHTAAETALESDISATAITGGVVVYTKLLSAGSGNQATSLSLDALNFDLPNGEIITLCTRTISGSGSIVSHFRIKEEW